MNMTMTKARKRDTYTAGDLSFPNPSRSYDETVHGVRFWGYDQTIEVSFFIEANALSKLNPNTKPDETGLLNIFDVNRNLIHKAAGTVYSRWNLLDKHSYLNLI